ncbi:HopJ type III effector protein [Methylomonas sp. MED-D]|nr:HopJ type III effector protein [Methylomonas sp. MV1]MDT4329354.1 HopJ type III effector protein [Methylomonas sp. MV1]
MSKPMMLNEFLLKIRDDQPVTFQDSITVISENYHYQPTEFSNGSIEPLLNRAGQNEGSCKLFAFGALQGLTVEQTLSLFGDYYRKDVLEHPDGDDHQNIRRFMRDGWDGIRFSGEVLTAK